MTGEEEARDEVVELRRLLNASLDENRRWKTTVHDFLDDEVRLRADGAQAFAQGKATRAARQEARADDRRILHVRLVEAGLVVVDEPTPETAP